MSVYPDNQDYPFERYMSKLSDDQLTGIYGSFDPHLNFSGVKKVNDRIVIDHTTGNIPWIQKELNDVGVGARFMLPSIGTQIVKLHELGNKSDILRDSFREELLECANYTSDLGDDMWDGSNFTDKYTFLDKHLDEYFDLSNRGELNNELSPIMAVFLDMLAKNPDYQSLITDGVAASNVPTVAEMTNKISSNNGVYHTNLGDKYDTDDAVIRNIASFLFKSGTQTFNIDDEVVITDNRLKDDINSPETSSRHPATTTPHTSDHGFPRLDDSATIVTINNVHDGQYSLTISAGGHFREVWASEDALGNLADYRLVNASDLKPAVSIPDGSLDLDDLIGDVRTKGGKKKKGQKKQKVKKTLHASVVVFQRIVFDTLATLQVILDISNKFKFDGANSQFTQDLKLRYLSGAMNATIKNQTVYEQYPNMMPLTAENLAPVVADKLRKKKKKSKKGDNSKKGLLDYLATVRAYYTLSILNSTRAGIPDKASMDSFYGQSILHQETQHLLSMVSDSTTFAKRKEDTWNQDYTAQLQYDEVQQSSITQLAYAPKRTVYYEIDAPLLKEIIGEYLNVYNQMVVAQTYDVDNNQPNESGLASALWGSVRNRTRGLFDIEGLRAHEFFDKIFRNIEDRIARSTILRNHYPPNWLADNTMQKLRVDPRIVGRVVEDGYYQSKLNEYIDHLGNVYRSNYAVPLQIITEVERSKVRYNNDIANLMDTFLTRIKDDNAKKRLKTTWYLFKPYGIVIAILRAHLDIPFTARTYTDIVSDAFKQKNRTPAQNQADMDEVTLKVLDADGMRNVEPVLPDGHPLKR
jgi:orotate phosphoribosyltransferase-like protein